MEEIKLAIRIDALEQIDHAFEDQFIHVGEIASHIQKHNEGNESGEAYDNTRPKIRCSKKAWNIGEIQGDNDALPKWRLRLRLRLWLTQNLHAPSG
jgi:hypothetical protein